jgi:hypothetical protein
MKHKCIVTVASVLFTVFGDSDDFEMGVKSTPFIMIREDFMV